MKLKPDVSLNELVVLVTAMVALRDTRLQLYRARTGGWDRSIVAVYEGFVGERLDRLWEAQQSAA
jgi:hypothetical protein